MDRRDPARPGSAADACRQSPAPQTPGAQTPRWPEQALIRATGSRPPVCRSHAGARHTAITEVEIQRPDGTRRLSAAVNTAISPILLSAEFTPGEIAGV